MTPPMEPAAELRQMANAVRQLFIALINEGFTEGQALTIVGQVIIANSGKGSAR